jgi:hypothetical protein
VLVTERYPSVPALELTPVDDRELPAALLLLDLANRGLDRLGAGHVQPGLLFDLTFETLHRGVAVFDLPARELPRPVRVPQEERLGRPLALADEDAALDHLRPHVVAHHRPPGSRLRELDRFPGARRCRTAPCGSAPAAPPTRRL